MTTSAARIANVTVVTVTYGERADLLRQTLASAETAGIGGAVVVDNGSPPQNAAAVRNIAAELSLHVEVVRHQSNTGSAGGFAAGIETAAVRDPEGLLWLLDDDSAAASDALEELMKARSDLLPRIHDGEHLVLLSYREDRRYQRDLVHQVPPIRVFPTPGGFAGFNIVDLPGKVVSRVFRTRKAPSSAPVEIPYGPYSGLLVPAAALRAAGPPEPGLVLYEDDAEFTRRLRRAGARIFLVPDSRLTDLDGSWYVRAPGRTPFGKLLLSPSALRVYYTVRNRIIFEERHWRGRPLVRRVNRSILLGGLTILGRATGSRERLGLLRRAVRDGECQMLGQPADLDLHPGP